MLVHYLLESSENVLLTPGYSSEKLRMQNRCRIGETLEAVLTLRSEVFLTLYHKPKPLCSPNEHGLVQPKAVILNTSNVTEIEIRL